MSFQVGSAGTFPCSDRGDEGAMTAVRYSSSSGCHRQGEGWCGEMLLLLL